MLKLILAKTQVSNVIELIKDNEFEQHLSTKLWSVYYELERQERNLQHQQKNGCDTHQTGWKVVVESSRHPIVTSVERNTTMRHTKAQVLDQFRYNWKVAVISDKSLKGDAITKREYWNNFVDSLNKEGLVSDYQANNWTNPFWWIRQDLSKNFASFTWNFSSWLSSVFFFGITMMRDDSPQMC